MFPARAARCSGSRSSGSPTAPSPGSPAPAVDGGEPGTRDASFRAARERAGVAPGLQARRHLRGRVPVRHVLSLLLLRGRRLRPRGGRGRADRREEDHHPRGRTEPHRAGHRVRLLLRACVPWPAAGRLRDDHGQLQPGDRLDRLRHLRPPLSRAADGRGRDRRRRGGDAPGRACRGHRPVGRPDPARARARARAGRGPDHRHVHGRDRPGRGPRALPGPARRAGAAATPERDLPHGRGGEGGGGAHRLPGRRPPELRPRGAGDGDRPRRGRPRTLRARVRRGLRRRSDPHRPVPAGRGRGRRRRPRGRTRRLHRRDHGAHREGRGSTPGTPPARSLRAPFGPKSSRRSVARRVRSPGRSG